MKLKLAGGKGDMFLGINDVKEIGSRDPLEFMLEFVSDRMKNFRGAKTFRVWGWKETWYSREGKVSVVEVEYLSRHDYIGYVRERYWGVEVPTTI